MDMTDKEEYDISFASLCEKLKNTAIKFMVNNPSMNSTDRNFFEMVAMLPYLQKDGYRYDISNSFIYNHRQEIRELVAKTR